MQRFSSLPQDLVLNQAVAERPDAAEGQIDGFGKEGDSLVLDLMSGAALPMPVNMQLFAVIEGLRRHVDNGRVPESDRDEIAEILDAAESSGLDPAARAFALGALQRLTATYDRMAQREAEHAETVAELQGARAVLAEIEAEAQQEAAEYRAARARQRQAERAAAQAAERQHLDAIRRTAIAAQEREESERRSRREADKQARRIEAERRAAENAEREAARLAQWPRRRGALAEGMA